MRSLGGQTPHPSRGIILVSQVSPFVFSQNLDLSASCLPTPSRLPGGIPSPSPAPSARSPSQAQPPFEAQRMLCAWELFFLQTPSEASSTPSALRCRWRDRKERSLRSPPSRTTPSPGPLVGNSHAANKIFVVVVVTEMKCQGRIMEECSPSPLSLSLPLSLHLDIRLREPRCTHTYICTYTRTYVHMYKAGHSRCLLAKKGPHVIRESHSVGVMLCVSGLPRQTSWGCASQKLTLSPNTIFSFTRVFRQWVRQDAPICPLQGHRES